MEIFLSLLYWKINVILLISFSQSEMYTINIRAAYFLSYLLFSYRTFSKNSSVNILELFLRCLIFFALSEHHPRNQLLRIAMEFTLPFTGFLSIGSALQRRRTRRENNPHRMRPVFQIIRLIGAYLVDRERTVASDSFVNRVKCRCCVRLYKCVGDDILLSCSGKRDGGFDA